MLSMKKVNCNFKGQFFQLLFRKKSTKVTILPKPLTYDIEQSLKAKETDTWTTDMWIFTQQKLPSLEELRHRRKWKLIDQMKKDQRFLPDRHKALGPDLAAAHFITFRKGKVKFTNKDEWITKEDIISKKIPSAFDLDFRIEAVDASETNLRYEGFGNLIHLFFIKELSLRNCKYIDDHCLNRLHIMQYSLEVLDLSGCHNITERGLCTLHVLKKLKKLIIHDTPSINHRELTCLLLQDVLPDLEIEGIDYESPSLLRRLRKYL